MQKNHTKNNISYGLLLLFNQRYCTKCNTAKDFSEFWPSRKVCIACLHDPGYVKNKNMAMVKYRKNNREKIHNYQTNYNKTEHGKNIRNNYLVSQKGKAAISRTVHKRRYLSNLSDNPVTHSELKIMDKLGII